MCYREAGLEMQSYPECEEGTGVLLSYLVSEELLGALGPAVGHAGGGHDAWHLLLGKGHYVRGL